MTRDDALALLRDIMADKLGFDPVEVVPAADLRDDLGMDSLDAIDIVESVQEVLDRPLAEAEIEGLGTVADVLDVMTAPDLVGAGR